MIQEIMDIKKKNLQLQEEMEDLRYKSELEEKSRGSGLQEVHRLKEEAE